MVNVGMPAVQQVASGAIIYTPPPPVPILRSRLVKLLSQIVLLPCISYFALLRILHVNKFAVLQMSGHTAAHGGNGDGSAGCSRGRAGFPPYRVVDIMGEGVEGDWTPSTHLEIIKVKNTCAFSCAFFEVQYRMLHGSHCGCLRALCWLYAPIALLPVSIRRSNLVMEREVNGHLLSYGMNQEHTHPALLLTYHVP